MAPCNNWKIGCKNHIFPSGVAKSVLTLFLVEHMSVLDHAVVGNPLVETSSIGRSNRLGGGSNRLGQRRRWKPRFAAPGGTPSRTVRLGLSWDRQATQNFLNRRGDEGWEQKAVGKANVWRKNSKIYKFDWMIGPNRPQPFIFIGWGSCSARNDFYLGIKPNS
jgi:hypothetical protein